LVKFGKKGSLISPSWQIPCFPFILWDYQSLGPDYSFPFSIFPLGPVRVGEGWRFPTFKGKVRFLFIREIGYRFFTSFPFTSWVGFPLFGIWFLPSSLVFGGRLFFHYPFLERFVLAFFLQRNFQLVPFT